ncbi:hypothetical protein KC343_g12489 [Hortaea werneckii]|nr:hypothetical protein KC338_g5987 [Hortaea werneckii]KAI7349622.1 hypothetical protein KC320_g5967 [Hortaea werneckii]KAI7608970.1 hypothetical protein KC343_g12489 [Hortaea werneckii]KAI7612781.1 hypothetical protein KC346_g7646 [Hortaea werneckii]KAI7675004.1 hypothetical protein KC319_g4695 [Hortaea werneckii]
MSWKTVAERQQSDLQQLQARIDGLNRTVVERENTIHDLRFRLANTEEQLGSLKIPITNTDTVPVAALQEFQRRLQAVEVEKAQLAQNADRATAQLEYSFAEFRQYQQQAETQISTLRAKLAEYEQPRGNAPAGSNHVAVSTNTGGNRTGPRHQPLNQSRAKTARREVNTCPPYLHNDDQDDDEPDLAYMQKTVPAEPSSGPSQPGLPATPAAAAGQQARGDQAPQTGPSTTAARPEAPPPSTNLPQARNQTNTTNPIPSPLPSRPAVKQRGRRPKRNWSIFQDDDDDEYHPDTSPERDSPPSNPTPSKTRRLRRSTTAAAATTSTNPLPNTTTTTTPSDGGDQGAEPSSSSPSFPLPFKAIILHATPTPSTVDPNTGEWDVAEYFSSEDIGSELGELWDRLAVVREKWEVFKGPGWPVVAGAGTGGENGMGWLERKSFTSSTRTGEGGRGADGFEAIASLELSDQNEAIIELPGG